MPSTSHKQHNFMEAVAHSPGFAKKAGVPQSVGKDFAKADDKAGITKAKGSPKSKADHMARLSKHDTQKNVGKAMGTHQSTVSRTMRQGFNRMGSA